MKARQACVHLLVVALTGVPAAIAAWAVLGPGEAAAQHVQFDSVRARQFILVDGAGRYRGELLVDARGPALVQLAGADGKPGLTLGVQNNGQAFIRDASGRAFPAAQAQRRPGLPPVPRVGKPGGGGGKADAADQSDVRAVRGEIDAMWRQMQILLDRVDALSRDR